MNNFINTLELMISMAKQNMPMVLTLLAGLWVFNFINWFILGSRLNALGIYPRHPLGLIGIAFSPFLHGNFNHLFFNTIPLFLLLNFMLMVGMNTFYCVSIKIIVLSGLAVWLFARPAFHIGASSLLMGYWSYLLSNAYQNPSAFSIILALVTIYYLGSLLLNLFPSGPGVSWEGHVFGAAAGMVAAFTTCPIF